MIKTIQAIQNYFHRLRSRNPQDIDISKQIIEQDQEKKRHENFSSIHVCYICKGTGLLGHYSSSLNISRFFTLYIWDSDENHLLINDICPACKGTGCS